MKKTINIALISVLISLPCLVNAQKFELLDPGTMKLEKESDYPKYNDYIVSLVDWLVETPVNVEEDKRKKADAFLLFWLTNCPNVSIIFNMKTTPFANQNPELLFIYNGGWAKYVIQTGDTSALKANYAGIKLALAAYKKGNGYKKDKEAEKLIRLETQGKLEEWANAKYKDVSEN